MQTNKNLSLKSFHSFSHQPVLGVKPALKASTSHTHMQPRARTALEK